MCYTIMFVDSIYCNKGDELCLARQGYAKHDPERGLKRTDEFRADGVRIALTSGLTRKQVASDLGVQSWHLVDRI